MNEFRPDYVSPPGETLQETLEVIGMSQAELARRMGRPRKTINEIIQGKTAITPDTALQLELVLGTPASFWNNRERQYQEALARIQEEEQFEDQISWLETSGIPIKEMCQRGWIESIDDETSQVREVLRFYGVASVPQWESLYARMPVAFRQAKNRPVNWGAVTAWLRKGELDALDIDCQPYDEQKFRQALEGIRNLTCYSVMEIWTEVVQLCAAAGVAVVVIPEFPNTGVSGATRWQSPDKAILQLSLRYKRNDQFWFSFFHESGHIVKHGKRKLFLELEDRPEEGERTEKEANKFAADLLISPADLRWFLKRRRNHFSKQEVREFAAEIGIAPGIVVGRLQHDGHICVASDRRYGKRRPGA